MLDDVLQRCPRVVDGALQSRELSTVFQKNEVIGFYFSAHWCHPCRKLTPLLIKAYDDLRSRQQNIEIVFVSSDHSHDDFLQYFQSMPWLAVPDFPATSGLLCSLFRIWSIPTLVLLRSDGTILSHSGAHLLINRRDKFPWPDYKDPFLSKSKLLSGLALCALFGFILYFVLMAA
eukprot:gene9775-1975_t